MCPTEGHSVAAASDLGGRRSLFVHLASEGRPVGGNLAITVREEDGTEHRMDRWTNSMPYFINNMGLVRKDPEYLRAYLQTWYDFRKDWEENAAHYDQLKAAAKEKAEQEGHANYWQYMPKDDGFRHNMTPVYAQHPYLAPSEYGQVVVDYKSNKILHCQYYTSFGTIARICVRNDVYQNGEASFWEKTEHSGYPYALREFLEEGRLDIRSCLRPEHAHLQVGEITKIEDISDAQALLDYIKLENPFRAEENRQWNENYKAYEQWRKDNDDEECDFQEWREKFCEEEDRRRIWPDEYAQFVLDMSPFEVICYPESHQGFKQFREDILDLGFELTEIEEEHWTYFLTERYPSEEENDAGKSISGQSEGEG